jgi:hypothetical protein
MAIDPKSFESIETDADSDLPFTDSWRSDSDRRIKVIFKLLHGAQVPYFVEVVSSSAEAGGADDAESINTGWIRRGDLKRLSREPGVASVIASQAMPVIK